MAPPAVGRRAQRAGRVQPGDGLGRAELVQRSGAAHQRLGRVGLEAERDLDEALLAGQPGRLGLAPGALGSREVDPVALCHRRDGHADAAGGHAVAGTVVRPGPEAERLQRQRRRVVQHVGVRIEPRVAVDLGVPIELAVHVQPKERRRGLLEAQPARRQLLDEGGHALDELTVRTRSGISHSFTPRQRV